MDLAIFANPASVPVVPAAGFAPESRRPARLHASMPGYAPTELRSCPGLAERLGVRTVLVKDESERLGLPSFKILGASWATLTQVRTAWTPGLGGPPSLDAVRAALHADGAPRTRRSLVAATDGNHGRGVARMAALLGLQATILVPAGTAAARIGAIESEGAQVRVVDGTYDDAIQASARFADDNHLVISDTSWEGYQDAPRAVVEGYSTLFFEIDDAVASGGLPQPDVVVLQAGVGAFAAAGIRHYRTGRQPVPRTVVVEPMTANCLMVSAQAGTPTLVPGPHHSSMAGLNCGLPSTLAWPVVVAGTDVFVAIADTFTEWAMRALAEEGVVAGESGAAGLAGLMAIDAKGTAEHRRFAGLSRDACVLAVNTEGATDPDHYLAVVGRSAADVTAPTPHRRPALPPFSHPTRSSRGGDHDPQS